MSDELRKALRKPATLSAYKLVELRKPCFFMRLQMVELELRFKIKTLESFTSNESDELKAYGLSELRKPCVFMRF